MCRFAIELGPFGFETRVKFRQSRITLSVEGVDLVGAFLEFLFDALEFLHRFDDAGLECSDLLLQSIGLAHCSLVLFLVLGVFEVAVGAFEVGLVLGDLLFKVGTRCLQTLAFRLYFAYRKGVLFKLLFDLGTPLVCGIQRLFQAAKVCVGLL